MKATRRIEQLSSEELERYMQLDSRFDERYGMYKEAALVRGIGLYLDEEQVRREAWEKSVDERLAVLFDPTDPYDWLREHSDSLLRTTEFAGESGELVVAASLAAFLETQHLKRQSVVGPTAVFPISDPGPSKYDAEPVETEE